MLEIKKPERKNYQIGVRINETTYIWLKRLAVTKKVSVPEVLRAIIDLYFKDNDR